MGNEDVLCSLGAGEGRHPLCDQAALVSGHQPGRECGGHWGSKSVKSQQCKLQPEAASSAAVMRGGGMRGDGLVWCLCGFVLVVMATGQTSLASCLYLYPSLGLSQCAHLDVSMHRSLRSEQGIIC